MPATRSERTPARLVLATALGVVVASLALAVHWGLRNQALQADEFSFGIFGARNFRADFFAQLLSSSPVNRGPERLAAILLIVPQELFGRTHSADGFRFAHVMFALVGVSAALPAYGLGRLLELERWQAAVAAALTVATPWLIFETTLLNNALAFPTVTLLLWATTRGALRPSPAGDLLIVVAMVLAAIARTGDLPFLAVPAAAVLVQTWRDRPAEASRGQAARGYPLRLLRAHPLLVVLGVLVLAFVVHVGAHRIVGGQYAGALPQGVTLGVLAQRAAFWSSVLTLGTGYVPLMIGLPWLLRHAVRPVDRTGGAFAVVGVAAFAAYVAGTVQAPPEERYVAVLAVVPAVAFVVAVSRRQASTLATLVAGGYLARQVVHYQFGEDTGAFSYMVAPARQVFHRVIRGQFTRVPLLPDADTDHVAIGLAVLTAVVVAALHRGRPLPRAAARWPTAERAGVVLATALAALIAALGLVSQTYASRHWTAGEVPAGQTWEQRTFVDGATGGADALGYDEDASRDGSLAYGMGQALAYDLSLTGSLRDATQPPTWQCCFSETTFTSDRRTGAVTASRPLPRFLVEAPSFRALGFAGPVVATSPALPGFAVRRIGARPRLAYALRGQDPDGYLVRGRRAVLRLYAGVRCARLTLAGEPAQPPALPAAPGAPAPPLPPPGRPGRYAIRDAAGVRQGQIAPDAVRTLVVRAARGAIHLRGSGGSRGADGRHVTLRVVDVTAGC